MSGELIDRAALKRLLDVIGGDPEDLAELIEEFETFTPNILLQMKEAASAGDLEALRISSHSLKSSGRDFGATALAQSCESLENACREGNVDDPADLVSKIGAHLDAARDALTAITYPGE